MRLIPLLSVRTIAVLVSTLVIHLLLMISKISGGTTGNTKKFTIDSTKEEMIEFVKEYEKYRSKSFLDWAMHYDDGFYWYGYCLAAMEELEE